MLWTELVRAYAISSREHSDAVARLGSCAYTGPEFMSLLDEATRCKMRSDAAWNELCEYLNRRHSSNLVKAATR
jgi:hypothetical protein